MVVESPFSQKIAYDDDAGNIYANLWARAFTNICFSALAPGSLDIALNI